ncbi:unnamed protein product [Amoebophrya sp. A120]|nr:unnamed protein product [Amoebophrya sp. A120]|eukprot:GSA120T00014339001.1
MSDSFPSNPSQPITTPTSHQALDRRQSRPSLDRKQSRASVDRRFSNSNLNAALAGNTAINAGTTVATATTSPAPRRTLGRAFSTTDVPVSRKGSNFFSDGGPSGGVEGGDIVGGLATTGSNVPGGGRRITTTAGGGQARTLGRAQTLALPGRDPLERSGSMADTSGDNSPTVEVPASDRRKSFLAPTLGGLPGLDNASMETLMQIHQLQQIQQMQKNKVSNQQTGAGNAGSSHHGVDSVDLNSDDFDYTGIVGYGQDGNLLLEPSKWTKYKLYLWLFLEEPFVSPAASVVSYIIVILIGLSFAMSAAEQQYHNGGTTIDFDVFYKTPNFGTYARFFIVLLFTLEACLRFAIAPQRKQFWFQPNNVADIISVLPYWCNNVCQLHENLSVYFHVISIFSSFFWLLKLTRYFSGWFLLSRALTDAGRALMVPVFFLMIVVMCGSSLLLLFEKAHAENTPAPVITSTTDEEELCPELSDCVTIDSLFKAIHYTIVSVVSIQITEVYGKDVASNGGRVWSVIMMFLGVIFLSMPIAIVGTSFSKTWFEQDIIIVVEKVRSRMRQQGYTTDDLREVFNELDEDGSGSIEFNEFKRMLEAFHFFGSLATCRKLFNHFDCNGTGSISYQEFVCGIFPEIIDVDELLEYDEELEQMENAKNSSGSATASLFSGEEEEDCSDDSDFDSNDEDEEGDKSGGSSDSASLPSSSNSSGAGEQQGRAAEKRKKRKNKRSRRSGTTAGAGLGLGAGSVNTGSTSMPGKKKTTSSSGGVTSTGNNKVVNFNTNLNVTKTLSAESAAPGWTSMIPTINIFGHTAPSANGNANNAANSNSVATTNQNLTTSIMSTDSKALGGGIVPGITAGNATTMSSTTAAHCSDSLDLKKHAFSSVTKQFSTGNNAVTNQISSGGGVGSSNFSSMIHHTNSSPKNAFLKKGFQRSSTSGNLEIGGSGGASLTGGGAAGGIHGGGHHGGFNQDHHGAGDIGNAHVNKQGSLGRGGGHQNVGTSGPPRFQNQFMGGGMNRGYGNMGMYGYGPGGGMGMMSQHGQFGGGGSNNIGMMNNDGGSGGGGFNSNSNSGHPHLHNNSTLQQQLSANKLQAKVSLVENKCKSIEEDMKKILKHCQAQASEIARLQQMNVVIMRTHSPTPSQGSNRSGIVCA